LNRSVYLTHDEDELLRTFATEHDLKINTCIAIAVRSMLGLPVPRWAAFVLRDKEEAPA
jgi:hypothetical protein